MKPLTCEMCNSTDVVKDGEYFICQVCETKYSIEEAKKMILGETDEVIAGTVKADRSIEIKNRLENIKNEFNNGNNDNVKRMCLELLNIDPENYQAIMFGALAEGWQSSISNPKIGKASVELQRAVNIIRKLYEDDATYTELCIEPMRELRLIAEAMFKLYVNHNEEEKAEYDRCIKDCKDAQTDLWNYINAPAALNMAQKRLNALREHAQRIDRERVSTYNNGCAGVCRAVNNLAIEIINQIQEATDVCKNFYDEIVNFVNVCKGYLTEDGVLKQYNSIIEYWATAKQAYIRKQVLLKFERITKYWEEHPEEKSALDAKLATVESKLENAIQRLNAIEGVNGAFLAKLQSERDGSVPSENDKRTCEKKISEMEAEYKSLGIFKVKEKKVLMEKISNEKINLNVINNRIKKEKLELAARIDAEIKALKEKSEPIHQEIADLNKQKDEINAELKKDR